jgi:hypothetical protein
MRNWLLVPSIAKTFLGDTQLVIVGARPAGMTLGHLPRTISNHCAVIPTCIPLRLKFGYDSWPSQSFTLGPARSQGIYRTGDAMRVFHNMGLGSDMMKIANVRGYVLSFNFESRTVIVVAVQKINFHQTSILARQFFVMDAETDTLNQTLSNMILQIQLSLGECSIK